MRNMKSRAKRISRKNPTKKNGERAGRRGRAAPAAVLFAAAAKAAVVFVVEFATVPTLLTAARASSMIKTPSGSENR